MNNINVSDFISYDCKGIYKVIEVLCKEHTLLVVEDNDGKIYTFPEENCLKIKF